MMKGTALAAMLTMAAAAQAQDIVGVEDCSKARDADKKVGCLQSNVNFLHELIRKNDAAARASLREANARLTAATTRIEELRAEIERLKTAVKKLEKPAR